MGFDLGKIRITIVYWCLGVVAVLFVLYGVLLLQPTLYSFHSEDELCWTFGFAERDFRLIVSVVHPLEKAKRRRALIKGFLVKSRFLDLHRGEITSADFIANTTNVLFLDGTYKEIRDNYLIVYPEHPLDPSAVLMVPSYSNDSEWPIVLVGATLLNSYVFDNRKMFGRRIKIPQIVYACKNVVISQEQALTTNNLGGSDSTPEIELNGLEERIR